MDQLPREIPKPRGVIQVDIVAIYKFIRKIIHEKFNPAFLFRRSIPPADVVDSAINESRAGSGSG